MFFKRYASFIPRGTYPRIRRLTKVKKLFHPDGEAALDLDCAYPIVYPQIIETLQSKKNLEDIFSKGEKPPYVISTSYYEGYEQGPNSKKHFTRSCNGYVSLYI